MIKRIHRWGEKLDELHNQMDDHMGLMVDVKFLGMFHNDDVRLSHSTHNIIYAVKDSL